MEHRRRGADFSHLLESFLSSTTDCGSAVESLAQESESQVNTATSSVNKSYNIDKKISSKVTSDGDTSGSFKSTILAGHSAESESERISESSYQTAQSTGTVGGVHSADGSSESCLRSEPPSVMNRAITPQFSPRPELDLSQTTEEPRSSGEMNRNIVSGSERSSDASRDTNHNLKSATQSPRHNFQPTSPRNCGMSRNQDPWSMLSSLDNVLDPSGDKTGKSKHKILRRLSQEFWYSPRTFTDRLVTIIDESNTGCGADDTSGVNLSRMTKEFRKMCKFIQDESMPEMAPSLCINSTTGNARYPNKTGNHDRPETIAESPTDSPSAECKTPESHDFNEKKIYRKTPLNIFKKTFRDNKGVLSPGSPNSTKDFEFWEKHCEALPSSPNSPFRTQAKPLRRSLSVSDVSEESKEKLMQRCEELMRSLDETSPAELETFDSHRGRGAPDREIDSALTSNARDVPYAVKDDDRASRSCANYVDEDELSQSLLIEKEMQRQRCFETALVMQKIEEDAKKSNEEYPQALERHGIDPYKAFMQTITSCMQYKDCVSGMRQSNHVKSHKETSSLDSGIDTRSFGRTLYASSKKSCNEASGRNSQKQSQNNGPSTRDQRSGGVSTIRSNSGKVAPSMLKKSQRNTTSSKYLQAGKSGKDENRSLSPRRTYSFLRPPAKSSPSCNATATRCRNIKTPEKNTAKKTLAPSPVPGILVTSSTPAAAASKSPRGEEHRGISLRNRTPQRSKSPGMNILSPKPSPRTRVSGKETPNHAAERREKSPASGKKMLRSPCNKFFVTPGRNIPVKRTKTAKSYFPSMDDDIKEVGAQRMIKSIHCPGIYRTGIHNTIVSPVSMYIRGTDVNLITNNHERKNEMMLTPNKGVSSGEKLKFKLSSKTSTPSSSPRINYRLFDKEGSDCDENDENKQEIGFGLPMAKYCQPAQVHTVNESPNRLRGPRTRGLLESMQNRVVIRHEAKRFGEYEEEEVVPESSSGGVSPIDMSIHVLKSAEKTNFMSRRKL